MISSIVSEQSPPRAAHAAPRLGQYLARQVDDDGHVGLDLDLDADDAAEGAIHRQVDGAPAAARAGVALGYLLDDADLDKAGDLIGHSRLVEPKPFGYAYAADARILPNRPDYREPRC